jgi:hypothetical protein
MLKQIQIGLRSLAVLVAGVAFANNITAAPSPVTTATPLQPTPPAIHHAVARPAVSSLTNPHLHGAKPAVTKSTKKDEHKKIAHHWVGRWSFADWAVLHRGTGTITGEVHVSSGSPAAGARVALRTAKGGTLRNPAARHVTHTTSGGHFVMRHVRIGSYRVRGSKGKAAGHAAIKVHGGQMTTAHVKI